MLHTGPLMTGSEAQNSVTLAPFGSLDRAVQDRVKFTQRAFPPADDSEVRDRRDLEETAHLCSGSCRMEWSVTFRHPYLGYMLYLSCQGSRNVPALRLGGLRVGGGTRLNSVTPTAADSRRSAG